MGKRSFRQFKEMEYKYQWNLLHHRLDFKSLLDRGEIEIIINTCNQTLKQESSYIFLEGNLLGMKIDKPNRSTFNSRVLDNFSETEIEDEANHDESIPIANFIIFPLSEIVKHYLDGHETRHLELCAIQNGMVLKPITIPVEELLNEKWIYQNWGIRVRLTLGFPYRHVLHTLQILSKDIQIIHNYNYPGWLGDRNWIFLHGSGVIGRFSKDQIVADESISELALTTSDITEEESIIFIFETMLKMANKKVSWVLFSYTLLSLITSRLQKQCHRPEYILYIVGESGLRKTSLSIRFFNIFERYLDAVPIQFDMTTQPAMEIMGMTLKDCVCLYDDIPPSKDNETMKNQERKLEALIRTYGESIGRQKMDSSNKKVEMKPSGLAAVTAESMILKNPSSISRTLTVKVDKDSVNLKKLSIAQKKKYHFPTAIRFYLEFIAEQGDFFIQQFIKNFLQTREMFNEIFINDKIHGRLIHAAAWQQTSFSSYLDYVETKISNKQREYLNFDSKKIKYENTQLLIRMLKDQQQLITGNSEVNLFVRALKELLATNKIRLLNISLNGNRKETSEDYSQKDIVGFIDSECLYLFKDTTYNLVCSHYRKQNIMFSTNLGSLLEALDKKGILKVDNNKDKTKTVRVSINNNRIRVIRLDRDSFETWDDCGAVGFFFNNEII